MRSNIVCFLYTRDVVLLFKKQMQEDLPNHQSTEGPEKMRIYKENCLKSHVLF